MNVKKSLYEYCLEYVDQRVTGIQNEIHNQQSSANEETKSSAGDKYETGRAMAQREIDMYNTQLSEVTKLRAKLLDLPIGPTNVVSRGALVDTNHGIFYIAISIGVAVIAQNEYYIISPESPVGQLLIGKRVDETVTWNGKAYKIKLIE